jgi:hypothetical protein
MVIRTKNATRPIVDTANSKYVPGQVEGDVLVFEIDSGKHLGGYRYSAANGAQLTVNLQDPERDLVQDVSTKMWSSIRDGMAKSDPTSKIVNLY